MFNMSSRGQQSDSRGQVTSTKRAIGWQARRSFVLQASCAYMRIGVNGKVAAALPSCCQRQFAHIAVYTENSYEVGKGWSSCWELDIDAGERAIKKPESELGSKAGVDANVMKPNQ